MTTNDALTFNDGYVLDRDTILLASQLREHAREDRSLVTMIKKGQWLRLNFDDAAVSVAGIDESRDGYFLGANGDVLKIGKSPPSKELVGDVKRYGEMLRVRNVAGTIYATGMNAQVYQRADGEWQLISGDIVGAVKVDFEDIGGTANDDLWAVGTPGSVYHFDRRRWQKVEVPTNRPLGGVKCVAADKIFVCGDQGSLFLGDGRRWEFIGDPAIDDIFWSVEWFQGKLYVAYDGGVMCHDGTQLSKVEFGIPGLKADGYRLHANDGVLWSIGQDTLLVFDGTAWHQVEQPVI